MTHTSTFYESLCSVRGVCHNVALHKSVLFQVSHCRECLLKVLYYLIQISR